MVISPTGDEATIIIPAEMFVTAGPIIVTVRKEKIKSTPFVFTELNCQGTPYVEDFDQHFGLRGFGHPDIPGGTGTGQGVLYVEAQNRPLRTILSVKDIDGLCDNKTYSAFARGMIEIATLIPPFTIQ